MWRHIIKEGVTDVDQIEGLPKALYEMVRNDFAITTSEVVTAKTSKDGATTKLLVKLQDGKLVESVIMRYGMHAFNNSFPEHGKKKHEADPENVGFLFFFCFTVFGSSTIGCFRTLVNDIRTCDRFGVLSLTLLGCMQMRRKCF
jgi:adenine C2-methylase RlmN of 23S rRNA A2503 and tRNA A37